MKIKLNGKELYINNKLYSTAEQISNFMLQSIKAKTEKNNQKTLFYAIIIALHKTTGEMLHLIDEDMLDLLMKAWDVVDAKNDPVDKNDF